MGLFENSYKISHQRTTMTSIHKKVIAYLEHRNVKFEIEKEFTPYSVDIYLPKLNVAIECDGGKWHGYPYGTERDKKRDKLITSKYGVKHIYRIWGCDINKNSKLNLILDGILKDNLIIDLNKKDEIILKCDNKYFRGYICKRNKLSYSAYFKSINCKLKIDKNGLTKFDGHWKRCVLLTKKEVIPIWCKSIVNRFVKIIETKNIIDGQCIVDKIKKFIGRFDK